MGGFDDNAAIMGDWVFPSPSPRTFFSSMMSDDVIARSTAESGSEDRDGPAFPWSNGQVEYGNIDQRIQSRASTEVDESSSSTVVAETKTSFRGGLVERMAARAGISAPRLNTENIRLADISKNAEVGSPLFTVPPGFSPTGLLDSPVFLSNSSVLPSPTTGKFSFPANGNNPNSMLMNNDTDKGKENAFEDVNGSSFAFQTAAESRSFPYFNAVNRENPSSFAPHSFPTVGMSVHADTSNLRRSIESHNLPFQHSGGPFQQENMSKPVAEMNRGCNLASDQTYTEQSPSLEGPNEDDGDQRSNGDPNAGGGAEDDGYNWRKYGQKQVKGSEYPRSYYKCTYPNCPVKKKVERSHEGHITEIIYKGAHNHPKPPPNRRSAFGSSNALNEMQPNSEQHEISVNGDLAWSNMQKGNFSVLQDWRQENLEVTSAALGQKYGNGATNVQIQNGTKLESGDCMDGSSTFSNDDDDDDGHATHASVSLGYDGEGDESESKRRRIEPYASDMSGATRAIREPRVVVQTTSEVDILDDGYRWRKYGQKVVKGNPNPRSYYKCTSNGCNVRKHVERASHDLKSVITTYEGKHNHDVPAARNNSHINSGGSNQQASAAASGQVHRPDPSQVHGHMMARFERNSMGSFGPLGGSHFGPGPGFGYGINQPSLAGLGLAGFGPGQRMSSVMPVHPYLGQPRRPMNDMAAFMVPKEEPKSELVTESGLNLTTNGSSVYQQLMSRMPPGSQM